MAKTTVTIGEFILNVLSAEQFAAAVKAGEIDPNQIPQKSSLWLPSARTSTRL